MLTSDFLLLLFLLSVDRPLLRPRIGMMRHPRCEREQVRRRSTLPTAAERREESEERRAKVCRRGEEEVWEKANKKGKVLRTSVRVWR